MRRREVFSTRDRARGDAIAQVQSARLATSATFDCSL